MAELRIGTPEREHASRQLGEHYALGRLDDDEYAERLDAAWSARTTRDLAVLFHDLPRLPVPAPPQRRPTGADRFHWSRVPLVPLLLVAVAASVLTGHPWWMVAVVWWFLAARHRAAERRRRRKAGRHPQCWEF